MYTSGTTNFELDLNELVEEAFERCGAELTTGYDLRTARRSLNLLLIEWGNRGVNLWTVSPHTVDLQAGRAVYPLPADAVDVMDCFYRYSHAGRNQDRPMGRLSAVSYMAIPNKGAEGEPTQFWVNRQSGHQQRSTAKLAAPVLVGDDEIIVTSTTGIPQAGFIVIGNEVVQYTSLSGPVLQGCIRDEPSVHSVGDAVHVYTPSTLTVWPVPKDNGKTVQSWLFRRMQDAGQAGSTTPDVPYRFLPALTAGLSYYLASKIPGVPSDRMMYLKQDYEEQWAMAATEDREKANLYIVPAL